MININCCKVISKSREFKIKLWKSGKISSLTANCITMAHSMPEIKKWTKTYKWWNLHEYCEKFFRNTNEKCNVLTDKVDRKCHFLIPDRNCHNTCNLIWFLLWSNTWLISIKPCSTWWWVMQFQPESEVTAVFNFISECTVVDVKLYNDSIMLMVSQIWWNKV
jgi:hypothetical protein